jgi:hypothetical protein
VRPDNLGLRATRWAPRALVPVLDHAKRERRGGICGHVLEIADAVAANSRLDSRVLVTI